MFLIAGNSDRLKDEDNQQRSLRKSKLIEKL
jgi:hypothetical protein